MSDAPTYEQLQQLVGQLAARVVELERVVAEQADEIAELKRQSSADSSNSSRPPSSDAPWAKKPAKKRSSRTRSGRKPGKQPGAFSSSRSLVDDAEETLEIRPDRCQRCDSSLAGAAESVRQRRQVVDARPAQPPKVTEYQRVSTVCPCCGAVTTPGWDDAVVPVAHAETVAAAGSPVRIGPETLARAALLSCAHYLPVGRARDLLEALTAISVSTGFLAGIRGRAARRLEQTFLGHMQQLLVGAPVLRQRFDVQGEVKASGPGQQRLQPRRSDLGRVAGDDQGGGVPVAHPQVVGAVVDCGGAHRRHQIGWVGRVDRVRVVAAHRPGSGQQLHDWPFVMTASGRDRGQLASVGA